MIRTYDSLSAMHADYIASRCRRNHNGMLDWYNRETETETLRKTISGDTSLVTRAETLLSSLDTEIETRKPVWRRSPAGAFCSVPDVIAGLPTPMRHRHYEDDETAPINIVACISSSAALNAATLAKRGTVILALVMALSRIRPVSLHVLGTLYGRDASGETLILTRINTTPLDLATACYALTSSGFDRTLNHGLAERHNGFEGSWPRDFKYNSPAPYYASLPAKLGFPRDQTLIIPASQLGDELLEHPVRWVQTQINRFTASEAEE